MEPNQTFDELIAEGRRCLETGDKTHAHAFFETATQLYSGEASGWLLRAETAPDVNEAAACYEQVLVLDPENAQAREHLLDKRMNTLQRSAQAAPTPKAPLLSSGLRKAVLITGVAFLLTLALGGGVIFALSRSAAYESEISSAGPIDIPALNLPPTWTPIPTRTATRPPVVVATSAPTSVAAAPTVSGWKSTTDLNVRAGPGVGYKVLGVLKQGTSIAAVGRISDGSWLQIDYVEGNRLGWVARDYVSMTNSQVTALPVVSGIPVSSGQPAAPVVLLAPTPAPRADFILGRPVELSADCSKPWRVLGTIYDSQAGSRRLNGVLVRIWAFNQIQGTVSSGSSDPQRVGYWEWIFNRGFDVAGQVALVNPDGTLRSDPVNFQLTGKCDVGGATTQVVFDFVGH